MDNIRRTLVAALAAGTLLVSSSGLKAQTCLLEQFNYSDGALVGNGDWTGDATAAEIAVDNNAVKIKATGSSATLKATLAVDCQPCEDGIIRVKFRIRGGVGEGTLWSLWVDDPQGLNLARFYRTSTLISGRTAGLAFGYLTDAMSLTGGGVFDECEAVIDTVNNTTTYFLNGVLMTRNPPDFENPLSHGFDAAVAQTPGNSIGRIVLERTGNATATDEVTIDDIQIISCPEACSMKVNPTDAQISYGVQGELASPDELAFVVVNDNQTALSYTVTEVDVNGDPQNHAWLTLDKSGGGPLNPNDTDVVMGTINTTGLSAGVHVAYLKFEDDCAPGRSYTRLVKLFVGDCLTDNFAYADGPLDRAPGWSGPPIAELSPAEVSNPVTNPIVIEGGSVKLMGGTWPSGSSANYSVSHVLPAPCIGCEEGGLISAKLKIQAGSGASNIWHFSFDNALGLNFARWFGTATTVRGRIGGTTFLTPVFDLSGPGIWDELEVIIDPTNNTSQFFINGVDQGTLVHDQPQEGNPDPGDQVVVARLERTHNPGTDNDFLFFTDVSVSRCIVGCNVPVFDVRDTAGGVGADGLVTTHDFNAFLNCVTGPAPALGVWDSLPFECQCMDINGDEAIDQDDFGGFQRCYTGPDGAVVPGCEDM